MIWKRDEGVIYGSEERKGAKETELINIQMTKVVPYMIDQI